MRDYFNLAGKVALVTGGSSGLGVQFAKALANQGASIAIAARRMDRLEVVRSEIEEMGVKCIAVPLDVLDEESILKCVNEVMEKFGRIDILVNNAGVMHRADALSFDSAEWDRIMDTNMRGVFIISREVAKIMKEQKYGKIINIASTAGVAGAPLQLPYSASKGAVISFTRTLAAAMGPYNITVNCIAPGLFETEMTEAIQSVPQAIHMRDAAPLRRLGKAGEMDGIMIYFASDASSFCTGQVICIDGGYVTSL